MSAPAVRDRRGAPVVLGEELGQGGEGSVFAIVDRPGICAKIYRADKAREREEKIDAMRAARPPWLARRSTAWPIEPLYAADGRSFVGFSMPRARGMIELFQLVVPDERMAIAGWLTARDLCVVAARLARVVAGVHARGHCVGDLKPQNILVSPSDLRVTLIDTDSFQIRDPKRGETHRSIVITPEYAAPELCDVDLARVDRTPASDAFALAVLVHQLLLGGAHPFDGDPADEGASVARVPGRIRRGICPLVPGVTRVRPAAGAISIATLHEDLRALFVRAFGEGHAAPRARPSAAAWDRALTRAARSMIACRERGSHAFDRGLARCPWCDRRARTGVDAFTPVPRSMRAIVGAGASEEERLARLRDHARARPAPSEAERAWLVKTGAALGFDRARVAAVIEEARAPSKPRVRLVDVIAKLRAEAPRVSLARFGSLADRAPRGRRLAIAGASIAASIGAITGAIAVVKGAEGAAEGAPRRATCAVESSTAVIGNTRGKGAFLRAGPSTSSEKVGLPEGTVVKLTGRTRTAEALVWSEVEVPSIARAGWVATRYLEAER